MTDGRTSPTGPGATRQPPDPLQMSAAEKVMAEWEARHDVAARGRNADPEALQHYVARSRLTQPPPSPAVRPASERRDPGHRDEQREAQAWSEPAPPPPVVPEQPRPRSGSLLARLLRRSG